jgi:hypothetical protein
MMKFKTIGFAALAIAASSCFATQAQAQQVPETVADVITRALFNQSGDIYSNVGIDRQATLLLGLSFPDQEYVNDAHAVNKIVQQEFLKRRTSVVRTEDLPNPFDSSLLTNPPKLGAGKN